jgi:hypothetical protein
VPLHESDFLGGWVPHPLFATKAIVHPIAPGEPQPPEWPSDFVESVRQLVLGGFTAFTRDGTLRAARRLLRKGPVRLKAVCARGGQQQWVVSSEAEMSTIVDQFDQSAIGRGIVVEENLSDVRTFSVGRVTLGEFSASYVGVQTSTSDNFGGSVYGGSELLVTRGGFADLTRMLSDTMEPPCVMALEFDRMAEQRLGLVASRRNYDVVTGVDGSGACRHAVLEQSWRVGGATPAELAALEAFARQPGLRQVRAATVERYGSELIAPEDAVVYFHGDDATAGPLLKYAILQQD